jgi:hypothetical protein
MICPDCNGEDPECLKCEGCGSVCDVCGEASGEGLDLCAWCSGLPPSTEPPDLLTDYAD